MKEHELPQTVPDSVSIPWEALPPSLPDLYMTILPDFVDCEAIGAAVLSNWGVPLSVTFYRRYAMSDAVTGKSIYDPTSRLADRIGFSPTWRSRWRKVEYVDGKPVRASLYGMIYNPEGHSVLTLDYDDERKMESRSKKFVRALVEAENEGTPSGAKEFEGTPSGAKEFDEAPAADVAEQEGEIGECAKEVEYDAAIDDSFEALMEGETEAETGAEAGGETGGEAGAETGAEAGGETEAETGAEAGGETEAEAGGETEAEAGGETEAEAGAETEGEGEDAGLDVNAVKKDVMARGLLAWGNQTVTYKGITYKVTGRNFAIVRMSKWHSRADFVRAHLLSGGRVALPSNLPRWSFFSTSMALEKRRLKK